MKEEKLKTDLNDYIIQIVNTKHPKTTTELVELVKEKYQLPQQEILSSVLVLQKQQKIKLIDEKTLVPSTLTSYLSSPNSYWYWLTFILAIATTAIIFLSPENTIPFVYVRYILGSLFTLFLPGYTLIKVLFPSKEIDNLERLALSIGISLALVPVIALILNYSVWGITTTTITLSLLAFTLISGTIAVKREQQTKITTQKI